MKGVLIRIGSDASYGRWNAPVDPGSLRFVYVPIPDNENKRYRPGCSRTYALFREAVELFYRGLPSAASTPSHLPARLLACHPHLDPDFDKLTYGDNGARRGASIRGMKAGDFIVFYAGLQPVTATPRLVYAIVGFYMVERVFRAMDVPRENWDDNAHTRWRRVSPVDIVVRAKAGLSGRLERCIPFGEWRDRAYRVRPEILSKWGGLAVKNGYIQRSARPPMFCDPERFYVWFQKQNVRLIQRNNAESLHRASASAP